MNIKKINDQELIETRDVIKRELKYEEALNNPKLKDFRLTFIIAKEAIEQELFDRKQLLLI